ncbi:MAG: dihydroorotase [Bacteroidales bacterium]|nr:dihydroorotase [Bacteroidales bacterium]
MKKIVYNGTVVNEGRSFEGYVVIADTLIEQVGEGMPSEQLLAACDERYDVEGALILPGAIDDHVHFREPGMTHKADIASESRAAAAGGVTSVMDMPNCKPATVSVEALEEKMARAAATSVVNFSAFIGATDTNMEELKKVDFSRVCGIKAFLGSSTGGMLLSDNEATRRVFSDFGTIIAIHSEDEDIINANRARLLAEMGGDDLPLGYHSKVRSAEACFVSTQRAVDLARQCGTRLHVAHISTARELALFDSAPLSKKKITAEACVAHLLFTEADGARLGARIKCNPSVKTPADRDALRKALSSGVIDVVATDHAPHLLSEKEGGCLKAASGMPTVQFSLVAMLELAHQGICTTEVVVEKMCHAPAALYRIAQRGYLRPGYKADIAVVKPVPEGHTITDADVVSRCGWTPLNGYTVHHQVAMTMVNGTVAYKDGKVNETHRGDRLTFN